ncbi:MAG: hypothetical protein MJA29_07280 [Candidatus Omnitrophica bacterium]|nr:hypothetical protein [Candidatus Omnitrophota bacterium]
MSHLEGPAHFISKGMGKAIMDYRMLEHRDKVAVAVSGGKDSLTLLRLLHERRSFVPIEYELLAVHIDMGYPCHQPRLLAEYFEKLGIAYHIEKIDILKGKKREDISCFWCSWNRRKALFESAHRFKCTKVALGHHKDDIIETMLLNLFFHGEIAAMSPKQELFRGKIVLIRPLAYVEEDLIARYSRDGGFPHHACSCPNSLKSNRTRVGKMIAEIEKICPDVKTNIFRSLKRIKRDYLL